MKRFKIFSLAFLLSLTVGTISSATIISKKETRYVPTFATYQNNDASTYYDNISNSLMGNDLLEALQDLNKEKRERTVGYDSMGTDPSGYFKYTDYDPDYVQYDSNNQPYGTRISSFYTYTSATSWNREHVWPNSHGGGKKGDVSGPYIDADIHMPRPTITSENSNRGNSFFVEGMSHTSNGWDPYTAGYSANSRGEAARITFYCMIADKRLCIAPANTSPSSGSDPVTGIKYGSGHTMGNLETLIKWNLEYEVTQREKNRNEGAEYLQGNRNAFVDHPEYVCRIWGNVNDTTRQLCASSLETVAPTSVNLNKNTLELEEGKTEKLTYTFEPSDATNSFSWSSSDTSVATVNNGTVSAIKEGQATITIQSTVDTSISASCLLTVTKKATPVGPVDPVDPTNPSDEDEDEPTEIELITIDQGNVELKPGEKVTLSLTVQPSNASLDIIEWLIMDTSVATVSNGVVTAVAPGETTLRIVNKNNHAEVFAKCKIKVTQPQNSKKGSCGGNIITTSLLLSTVSFGGIMLLLFRKKKID